MRCQGEEEEEGCSDASRKHVTGKEDAGKTNERESSSNNINNNARTYATHDTTFTQQLKIQ